jgi:hypothetical protein
MLSFFDNFGQPNIYPKESISVFKYEYTDMPGKIGTGWVGKAYVNFKNKKTFVNNIFVNVILTDEEVKRNPDLDMSFKPCAEFSKSFFNRAEL